MQNAQSQLPDPGVMEAGLASVLGRNGDGPDRVTVLDRRPNVQTSTYPSEMVTCRLPDGTVLELLCKYGALGEEDSYGHRGGVPYEAEVYRHILRPGKSAVPRFYGVYPDGAAGRIGLIIEYLDGSLRLQHAADPLAIRKAARWIGEFHREHENVVTSREMLFLKTYDAKYYEGWARRTALFAAQLHPRYPWVPTLCEHFQSVGGALLSAPPTVIHGEYYPKNILVHQESIYPIDWESAAISAGEIDLASLVERWPSEVAHECELEYTSVRWPDGPPHDFKLTLAWAQLYLHFRWLGDRPEWTADERWRWRFEAMRSLGNQLGLI